MFGSDLSEICKQEDNDAPSFLLHFMKYIEKCGSNVVGLYRYAGKKEDVRKLRSMIDKGEEVDLFKIDWIEGESEDSIGDEITENWWEVNVVTTCVKQFFNELPEPLVPHAFFMRFIQAARIPDYQKKITALAKLMKQLPKAHFNTLKCLVQHLRKIVDSDENDMSAKDLGHVFGPIILQAETPSFSLQALQNYIVELIVNEYDSLFRLSKTNYVFGYDIGELCLEHQTGVPWFFSEMITYIEQRLDTVGIYRKAGESSSVNRLINKIERGEELGRKDPYILVNRCLDLNSDKLLSAYDVASCIKQYLKELPSSLIPSSAQKKFIIAARESSYSAKVKGIRKASVRLPPVNYNTLKALMQHLKKVANRHEENQMTATFLGYVFGPVLMQGDPQSYLESANIMHIQNAVVTILINDCDKILL